VRHFEKNMKEPKKRFKLSKINWIFALLVIGISALLLLRKDGINSFSIGYLFGSIVTVGLIPLIIAFVVWLVRGKKNLAGTNTFNIVLVFMCFGMLTENGTISKKKTDSINEISKSVSEYKSKIKNDEDVISAYQEHSTIVNDNLSKLIKNSTGNEQEIYRGLQKYTSINNSVMINWQKSYDSVLEPRILDYSILNNQTEFEYQIDVLKYYKKQSELYKNHFFKRKSLIADHFKNVPEENHLLIGIMKGINNKDSIQKPIFRPFIDSHITYSSNLIEMIEFLLEKKNEWQYKNDELIFNNLNLEEKFLSRINEIAEDENQINDLTEKLIEVM
jgi:hypothetical protein